MKNSHQSSLSPRRHLWIACFVQPVQTQRYCCVYENNHFAVTGVTGMSSCTFIIPTSDYAMFLFTTWTLQLQNSMWSYCCFVSCLADADCGALQCCRPESVSADETWSCTGAFSSAVTHQSSPAVNRHVVFRRRPTLRRSGWTPSSCLCT